MGSPGFFVPLCSGEITDTSGPVLLRLRSSLLSGHTEYCATALHSDAHNLHTSRYATVVEILSNYRPLLYGNSFDQTRQMENRYLLLRSCSKRLTRLTLTMTSSPNSF
jgi:hypothetical protein